MPKLYIKTCNYIRKGYKIMPELRMNAPSYPMKPGRKIEEGEKKEQTLLSKAWLQDKRRVLSNQA